MASYEDFPTVIFFVESSKAIHKTKWPTPELKVNFRESKVHENAGNIEAEVLEQNIEAENK